jgi:hypothetical protein
MARMTLWRVLHYHLLYRTIFNAHKLEVCLNSAHAKNCATSSFHNVVRDRLFNSRILFNDEAGFI